jgi:hypothetical protein
MELMRGCMAEEEKEEACVEREFDAFFGCFRHLYRRRQYEEYFAVLF